MAMCTSARTDTSTSTSTSTDTDTGTGSNTSTDTSTSTGTSTVAVGTTIPGTTRSTYTGGVACSLPHPAHATCQLGQQGSFILCGLARPTHQ